MLRLRLTALAALGLAGCLPDLSLPPPPSETDTTPPALSNGRRDVPAAKDMTKVHFSFSSNEALRRDAGFSVTAAGVEIGPDCVSTGSDFSCPFTVKKGTFAEGTASFEVKASDLAGNAAETFRPTETLRIDFTAPQLLVMHPAQVPQNGVLSFTVTPNEKLNAPPTVVTTPAPAVWLNGPFGCVADGQGVYTCQATVAKTAPLLDAGFEVTGQDEAGNPTTVGPFNVRVVEATAPIPVMGATVTPGVGRAGTVARIDFEAGEDITQCNARLAGTTGQCGAPVARHCTCQLTVPANGAPEGRVRLDLGVTNGIRLGQLDLPWTVDLTAPLLPTCALIRAPVGTDDHVELSLASIFDPTDAGNSYPNQGVVAVRVFATDGGLFAQYDAGLAALTLQGTSQRSLQRVECSALDFAGNESARVTGAGQDFAPPSVDSTRFVLTRNPDGTADTLEASPGAFADFPGPLQFWFVDGGAFATSGALDAGGGFGPITVGTPFAAPKAVTVRAQDKSGNVSGPLVVGLDTTAPVFDGGQLVRRVQGLSDQVNIANAWVNPGCALKQATFSRSPSGSPVEYTWYVDGGTLFDIGTPTDAPARLWVTASDKCGNVSQPAELLWGDTTPVSSSADYVERLPVGSLDLLSFPTLGWPQNTCVAVFVTVDGVAWAVPDSGTLQIPIGTPTTAPRFATYTTTDKCGNVSATQSSASNLTPPTADATKFGLNRSGLGAPDTVVTLPGALVRGDGGCAPATVRLLGANGQTVAGDAGMLGQTVLVYGSTVDGGIPVGNGTASVRQLAFLPADKCGNQGVASTSTVNGLLGADFVPPTVDATKLLVRDLVGLPDGGGSDTLEAASGAFSDSSGAARADLRWFQFRHLARLGLSPGQRLGVPLNADGSLSPAGFGAVSRVVQVRAEDKAGNTSAWFAPPRGDFTLNPVGASNDSTCCPDTGRVTMKCVQSAKPLATVPLLTALMLRGVFEGNQPGHNARDGLAWDCGGAGLLAPEPGSGWGAVHDTAVQRTNATLGYYPWTKTTFLMGGRTDAGVVATSRALQGLSWSNLFGPLPSPREGAVSATDWCQRDMYLFGGIGDGGVPTADTLGFAHLNGFSQWLVLEQNPFSPLAYSSAIADCSSGQNLVTLFGGSGDNRVFVFNIDTGVWTASSPAGAPAPVDRAGFAQSPWSTSAFLFGGRQGSAYASQLYRYDGGFSGLAGANTPSGRASPAVGNPVTGAVHFIGGESAGGALVEDQAYYPQSGPGFDGGTVASNNWVRTPFDVSATQVVWVNEGPCINSAGAFLAAGSVRDGGAPNSPSGDAWCRTQSTGPRENAVLIRVEVPYVDPAVVTSPQVDFTGMGVSANGPGVRLWAWKQNAWELLGSANDGGAQMARMTVDAGAMNGIHLFFLADNPNALPGDSTAKVMVDAFELRLGN